MKFANATHFNRKSGEAEGSAVLSTSIKFQRKLSLQMNCHPDRSAKRVVEGPAVHSTCVKGKGKHGTPLPVADPGNPDGRQQDKQQPRKNQR
jgi:hypothetical protein